MQPLAAIELLLLSERLSGGPELQLTLGRVLAARVVQPQSAEALGRLAIAGLTLEARLPEHLRAGDEVRVAVRELSPQRVTLALLPTPVAEPALTPMPGGGDVRVGEREASGPADGEQIKVTSLMLRYEAPHLGVVDLHFALGPDGLRLSVRGAAGEGLELMRAHLDELRGALRQAAPAASVDLASRRDLVRYA